MGKLRETTCHLPFISLYICSCQAICWLITCDNISFFSVLHVAVKGGYEQVANKIIQLVQQLPPTEEQFLDSRNNRGEVR